MEVTLKIFPLNRSLDSNELFHLTQQFANEKGTCLLYSGSSYETAKHSFLFLFPYDVISITPDKKQRRTSSGQIILSNETNPWNALKTLAPDIGQGATSFPEWVGFFGYEMGAYSHSAVTLSRLSVSTPDAYWQRCAITLKVDHQTGCALVRLVDSENITFLNESNKDWFLKLSSQEGWDALMKKKLRPLKSCGKCILKSISETKEGYLHKVEQAKEFIRSGDVYQINLSQQWEFLGSKDPFELFKQLAKFNPAPFSAYFYLEDFTIISSSPERFLNKQGNILETRPIKGTAPRGMTLAEDKNNKEALLSSIKEKAELMMITDLMRNDLGKISEIGSVKVPLICGCETYQNVFHLYSIVCSRALPSIDPIDLVRACFPGGSITGCPKLSSMEVIAKLESRSRGIYTGSIGYFAENGDFDLNIAIRTMVVENYCNTDTYENKNHKINIQLGGAIVIDSDPIKEYEETYHKGDSIFKILNH